MKVNKWKWTFLIVAGLALFLLGRSCGIHSITKQTGIDTTVRRDSQVIRYKPIPYIIEKRDTFYLKPHTPPGTMKPSPFKKDTVWVPAIDFDTAAVINDYFAFKLYNDTRKIGRATVSIIDTLRENAIFGRSVSVTSTDSTIIKTITLKPPRRIVGFVTGSLQANFNNAGVGIGFGLQLPDGAVMQSELKFLDGHRPMIEGRVMLPIRLIKKNN